MYIFDGVQREWGGLYYDSCVLLVSILVSWARVYSSVGSSMRVTEKVATAEAASKSFLNFTIGEQSIVSEIPH